MAVDQSGLTLPVTVGLDSGATRVRVARIEPIGSRFYRYRKVLVESFPVLSFQPGSEGPLSQAERDAGQRRVALTADLIARLVGSEPFRLGMAVAGRKSPDGRGVVLSLNGPRMPDYCTRLEAALTERSLCLAAPLERLGSDGDLSGWGEELAWVGSFRVDNAYYLGCGTGLAQALKVQGQVRSQAEIDALWSAPYAVTVPGGEVSFEAYLAASRWPVQERAARIARLAGPLRAWLLGILGTLGQRRVVLDRIVLGGHFRGLCPELGLALGLDVPVVASRLRYPALLGAGARVARQEAEPGPRRPAQR